VTIDDTDGNTRVVVEPPKDHPKFRPTYLMERVSRNLETRREPVVMRTVLDEVSGNREALIVALNLLAEEGHVRRFEGPRRAQLHESVKPFKESER
jgi:hypothetical protein